MVKWRIRGWGLGWHVTWILLKGKDSNQKLKNFPNLSKLGDVVSNRGGVEDTKIEAKVKDTKKFRGQGQGQTLSRPRPRTQTQVFSKKKVFKNFFQAISKKRSSKIFFQAISTWGNQKKVFAVFPQGFWRFPTKFGRFKNSAILEPRTGQFSWTWGFEATAKDFKMCSRGQELHLW